MAAHGRRNLVISLNFQEFSCTLNPGMTGTGLISVRRALRICRYLCPISTFSTLEMVDNLGIQLRGHPPR